MMMDRVSVCVCVCVCAELTKFVKHDDDDNRQNGNGVRQQMYPHTLAQFADFLFLLFHLYHLHSIRSLYSFAHWIVHNIAIQEEIKYFFLCSFHSKKKKEKM